jgi:hypothetical protein
MRDWFRCAGFAEEAFGVSEDKFMAVGSHRLTGKALPFRSGQVLFRFDDPQAGTAK